MHWITCPSISERTLAAIGTTRILGDGYHDHELAASFIVTEKPCESFNSDLQVHSIKISTCRKIKLSLAPTFMNFKSVKREKAIAASPAARLDLSGIHAQPQADCCESHKGNPTQNVQERPLLFDLRARDRGSSGARIFESTENEFPTVHPEPDLFEDPIRSSTCKNTESRKFFANNCPSNV